MRRRPSPGSRLPVRRDDRSLPPRVLVDPASSRTPACSWSARPPTPTSGPRIAAIPRDELLRRVHGRATGILALLTERVDDELLDAAGPQLRVVSNYRGRLRQHRCAGAASRRGIPVGNTPGVLTDTTADLAFALLMAAARRIPEGDDFVRAGKWTTWGPMLLLGRDVHGATLGIIGFGRIGREMARRGLRLRDAVLYHTHHQAGARSRPSCGAECVTSTSCCESPTSSASTRT